MKVKNLLLLLFLASLWGPSFLFIKVAVAEVPPITLVFLRVSLAAVVLFVILRWQGGVIPADRQMLKHLAIMALIHNSVPFVLFSWGEQYISSALASILNGTTPIFTIILAHFFVADDTLTPTKVSGTILGMGGLLLLIAPSFASGLAVTTWGLLAVTTAAVSYGVAIVYSRNHLRGLPFLVAPTMQMAFASLYLLPFSLLIDRPWQLAFPSWPAVASVVALALLGTAVAFVVYYRLLEGADASYVSMVTYVVPVFGVILGVLVLHEKLEWTTYLGCGLILVGVMIVNGVFKQIGQVWQTAVARR